MTTKTKNILSWVAQVAAGALLLMTALFKLSGAEESIYIFSTLGMEPYGRLGIGALQVVATVLLLWPRFAWAGGLLGMGLISGAIFFHLTKLGIVVQDDGGTLFFMAIAVWLASAAVVALNHARWLPILHRLGLKACGHGPCPLEQAK